MAPPPRPDSVERALRPRGNKFYKWDSTCKAPAITTLSALSFPDSTSATTLSGASSSHRLWDQNQHTTKMASMMSPILLTLLINLRCS